MSRQVAVLLLVVVAIAYTTAFPDPQVESQECGPNEEFKTCGTACPPTCSKPPSPICTLRCVIGCQCKEGFVKNNAGQCVLSRDC